MTSAIGRFWREHRAATAIEYGLIAGLIALGMIAALSILGTHIAAEFNTFGNKLS